MKVIITGGSGLIGNALSEELVRRGNTVWVLSRHPQEAKTPAGVKVVGWDGKTPAGWEYLVPQADAIINLAGANIGALPWSNQRKQVIRDSRVDAGHAVVVALQRSEKKPSVVVQIAGVGYYGIHDAEPLDEDSPAGEDYLASVAQDWENATKPAAEMGVRHVILRTGVVLAERGGVLAPFILQNKVFAGGPLGSGKQWISWIHIRDLVRVFLFALDRADVQGALNATSPDPATNESFERTVSHLMGRPFWIAAPGFILKAALGEMSSLVLTGQRVLPRRLIELGFAFDFPTLQQALIDLLPQKASPRP